MGGGNNVHHNLIGKLPRCLVYRCSFTVLSPFVDAVVALFAISNRTVVVSTLPCTLDREFRTRIG